MKALLVFAVLFTVLGAVVTLLGLFAVGVASREVSTRETLKTLWPAWVLLAIAAVFWICWVRT